MREQPNLKIISSRPCMGKTSFSVQWATTLLKKNSVLFISEENIEIKFMAHLMNISLNQLINGELNSAEKKLYTEKKEWLDKKPLHLIENFKISKKENFSVIKKEIEITEVKKIFIDGISRKDFHENNFTLQEYFDFIQSLKNVAISCDAEIILLHEMDRMVEKKTGSRRPSLEDLKKEKELISIADTITFLYREDYYNLHVPEENKKILEVITGEDSLVFPKKTLYKINTHFNQFSIIY